MFLSFLASLSLFGPSAPAERVQEMVEVVEAQADLQAAFDVRVGGREGEGRGGRHTGRQAGRRKGRSGVAGSWYWVWLAGISFTQRQNLGCVCSTALHATFARFSDACYSLYFPRTLPSCLPACLPARCQTVTTLSE